ncbi:ribonuclease H-like domain-containing protein [Tanacetum coccineum]
MAKQVELNNRKGKGTGQGENRPVWNNVQILNNQNKFFPKAVLTKTGIFLINTGRQNLFSQAATTSTARKVNTARPIVNETRQRNNFYKSHSPIRRPFNRTTTPRTKLLNQKVNTVRDKAVSVVGGIRETTVKPLAVDVPGTWLGTRPTLLNIKTIIVALLLLEMCDKKNKVLFTDTECLVLSSDFKLLDENQVLLRIPRQNNMYSFNLESIVPSRGLAYLIAKVTVDESNKWHRRLGHVNFKNLNKLVKGNLNSRTGTLLNSVGQKGSRGNTVMPELYNKMELLLVTKPQNKTPYELITGKIPIISYIRPFGCHVTILNTIDHLGKFEGKSKEGFLVGYSLNSKAFRVYNLEIKRVEENLHPVRSKNQANKTAGPEDANHSAGTKDNIDAGNSEMEVDPTQDYFVLPIYSSYTSTVKSSEAKNEGEKPNKDTHLKKNEEPVDQEDQAFLEELKRLKRQEKEANDAAEALRKEFAQEAEALLLQAVLMYKAQISEVHK